MEEIDRTVMVLQAAFENDVAVLSCVDTQELENLQAVLTDEYDRYYFNLGLEDRNEALDRLVIQQRHIRQELERRLK